MSQTAKIALVALLPLLGACGGGRLVQNNEYGSNSQRSRVQGRLGGTGDGLLIFGVDRSAQAQNAAAASGAGAGSGDS